MNTRICITFGPGNSIVLPDGLTSLEMQQVRDWTAGRITNRAKWINALAEEDVDAIKATKLVMLKRKGDSETRFDAVEFDFDTFDAYFIDDTGRTVEPDVLLDVEGYPLLDSHGVPKLAKNADGSDRWRYSDDGTPVPPTTAPPAQTATTRALSPDSSGKSLASVPGTPPTGGPAL